MHRFDVVLSQEVVVVVASLEVGFVGEVFKLVTELRVVIPLFDIFERDFKLVGNLIQDMRLPLLELGMLDFIVQGLPARENVRGITHIELLLLLFFLPQTQLFRFPRLLLFAILLILLVDSGLLVESVILNEVHHLDGAFLLLVNVVMRFGHLF